MACQLGSETAQAVALRSSTKQGRNHLSPWGGRDSTFLKVQSRITL